MVAFWKISTFLLTSPVYIYTYRKKAGKNHVGYVVNLAETCAEDNPVQIITHYQLEPNSASDVEMIQKVLPELQETTPVKDLYLDGGFYGSDVVKQAEDLGVQLHYTDMTGRNATSNKLPYNAFSIEQFKTILSCPQRHEPLRSNFKPESGILSVNGSKRAAIEGTNSALKRARGAGKLKVCGLVRCNLVMGLKTIAHNFHQIVRFLQGDTCQKLKKVLQARQGIVATT